MADASVAKVKEIQLALEPDELNLLRSIVWAQGLNLPAAVAQPLGRLQVKLDALVKEK
jgi:hypothetical protein